MHPDDRERVLREIREQVAERNDDHVRYRILRADGEVRWVEDWGHLAASAHPNRESIPALTQSRVSGPSAR